MNIKRIECDQFAGLTDKELTFDKGLNIVVGENESGKSTMVDLLFHMLFKDVKLDGRSDAEFIDKYFPKKVSGIAGDVIDGVLVFETSSGTYKLKKEWEKGEGACRLTLPDGTSVKGAGAIKEILNGELMHRAGVYSEIVFASQKRNQLALESIMRALTRKQDPLSDTRANLTSTLTQAAMETGGVALDKIEKNIKKKMDELAGRWDFSADAPEGGPKRASYKNAWALGAGSIVKAYYEADEMRGKQSDAENAERAVEREKADISRLRLLKKEAETEQSSFQKFRGILGQLSLLSGSVRELDAKIKESSLAAERWPKLGSDIARARQLRIKQKQAQIHELFLKAEPVHKAYTDKQAELEGLREVDTDDLRRLRELSLKKQNEEGVLAGINLVARIKKTGQAEINVTSIASGDTIAGSDGEILIREAVAIDIPGVMEMELLPQGVDAVKVRQEFAALDAKMRTIYERYGVSSLGELQAMYDMYQEAKREVENLRLNFERLMGDNVWEELASANDKVPAGLETAVELKRQLTELCGTRTVDAFIGGLEATLSELESKYENIENLKASIDKLGEEREKKKRALEQLDDIPEKYRGVDDPEQYDAALRSRIEGFDDELTLHGEKLREAERRLGDKPAEEYAEELKEKEAALGELKTEYVHWLNIYGVFCRLKDEMGGSPIGDIEAKFREYLETITDDKLKLTSMDEQMGVQLASGAHALTYDILSAGTKETVSLSFRLAMLEHLYPEGGGLAVFDDPFTDMDAKRAEQSCRLIRKFAENNQVIFVTCDDKYKDYLPGNRIYM